MKEKPILFSGPMVEAILDGRKTQTRRVIKPQPDEDGISLTLLTKEWMDTDGKEYKCPYGEGRRNLWVREAFVETLAGIDYRANGNDHYEAGRKIPWRPSIHMPRWASRINLEITDIRVERVQDISKEDCIAEGMEGLQEVHAGWHQSYAQLWDSINGKPRIDGQDISWIANPWVWVITFKKIKEEL